MDLLKAPTILEKARGGVIHKNQESSSWNSPSGPADPLLIKPYIVQGYKKEVPINMIIGLLNIKFTQHPRIIPFQHWVHYLIGHKHGF